MGHAYPDREACNHVIRSLFQWFHDDEGGAVSGATGDRRRGLSLRSRSG
jgi:hypothetical protein